MSESPSVERRSRPKATLFCPSCEHESHVGGDWVVRTTATQVRTECPDCGTPIDDRPRQPDRPGERSPATDPSAALGTLAPMRFLVRLQRYVLDWWSRHGTRYAPPRSST